MNEILDNVITTKNVKESLESYALDSKTSINELDFNVLKLDTYIKTSATSSFELFPKDVQKTYHDKDRILKEHIEFNQLYTIKVFKKDTSKLHLHYTIELTDDKVNPFLILSPKSVIPHKSQKAIDTLKMLFEEINKIKIYNQIIINLFDEEMKKTLKLLVKYIYAKKFTKRVKIPLFSGIKPIIAKEDKLIFWFLQQESSTDLKEVEEGEILVEYKKPKYGQNGFNCFGKIIDDNCTDSSNQLKAKVDEESIRILEDRNSKKYISKLKGYVHYDKIKLVVNNKLHLNKVSRNKDIIDSENEQNNIKIIVSENDTNRDSIGEGVKLTSENIIVDGFVGAKSILEATNLDIRGATHQDSKQFAKVANINRHKGTLRCHEGHIKLLEGGIVHATNIEIDAVLNGMIFAQNVTIGQVKSNLKICASESIKIKVVSGEDNIFQINYKEIPILLSKIDFIKYDIDELRYKLSQAKRHNPDEAKKIQLQINSLRDEMKEIAASYKKATIEIDNPFKGLNQIIFTIDDEHEIIYKTQNIKYDPFCIELKDDKAVLLPVRKSISL